MIRNIARIVVGFLLIIPASAMHSMAREYMTEPSNLPRIATARSIDVSASLMDMGAGALILLGAAPLIISHFSRPVSPVRVPEVERIALSPPQSQEPT